MNCNFSVTFIESLNQSNIKPCLIVHLVAMWTLIYLVINVFNLLIKVAEHYRYQESKTSNIKRFPFMSDTFSTMLPAQSQVLSIYARVSLLPLEKRFYIKDHKQLVRILWDVN